MSAVRLIASCAGALAAVATVFAPASTAASGSRYTSAPYTLRTTHYAFGQAPVFMPDGRVVFGKDFKKGDKAQVYIARQNGSHLRCITCKLSGPNNVPAVRPQGDWILFHSWHNQHFTIGSPGYGGLGSALYVVRPDGSHMTRITGLDSAHGAGEGEDDYHTYWSPDGRHIVWTHLNWNLVIGTTNTTGLNLNHRLAVTDCSNKHFQRIFTRLGLDMIECAVDNIFGD